MAESVRTRSSKPTETQKASGDVPSPAALEVFGILTRVEQMLDSAPRLFKGGINKLHLDLKLQGDVGISLVLEGPAEDADGQGGSVGTAVAGAALTATALTWPILPSPRPKRDRAAEAKRILALGEVHPRRCSEFVCRVLGVPYQLANDLMGSSATSLGTAPPYAGLSTGDIAGWVSSTGSGHVAVYIGESDAVAFIDVREPGASPRSKNGHYGRAIFESDRF